VALACARLLARRAGRGPNCRAGNQSTATDPSRRPQPLVHTVQRYVPVPLVPTCAPPDERAADETYAGFRRSTRLLLQRTRRRYGGRDLLAAGREGSALGRTVRSRRSGGELAGSRAVDKSAAGAASGSACAEPGCEEPGCTDLCCTKRGGGVVGRRSACFWADSRAAASAAERCAGGASSSEPFRSAESPLSTARRAGLRGAGSFFAAERCCATTAGGTSSGQTIPPPSCPINA